MNTHDEPQYGIKLGTHWNMFFLLFWGGFPIQFGIKWTSRAVVFRVNDTKSYIKFTLFELSDLKKIYPNP